MKKIFLLAGILCVYGCKAQFASTDSLHRYNNRYIRNSAVEAFSNLRLNTLLHGIIYQIDSAKAGVGGGIGIDTIYAVNDSTIRYKKNGITRNFTFRGSVDSRRFVDTIYMINDTVMRFRIAGSYRDVIIPGGSGSGGGLTLGDVTTYIDSVVNASGGVTKPYLDSVVATIIDQIPAPGWNDQVVIADSTMEGTGIVTDTLRVKRSLFYTRHETDSIAASLVSGGGNDNWGTDTVRHNYTLKGKGTVASPLSGDTSVLMTFRAFDSAKVTIVGADKYPGVDSANKITLGAYSNAFPTSVVVKNYIDALSVAAGTTLTGWFNILQYGGSANGTYTTGTDNSVALANIFAIAPNNSVVFIPSGTYRFLSAITWPTAKRLFLVCYGDLIFNSNNGFIIDNLNRPILWFYGSIAGTDQSGNPVNYGSQTNIGINLRNSRNTEVHINVITGFKYAIRCGGDGGGNQYNRIWFNNLNRNSVGIQMYAGGTTANGARWSNDNAFYGGQISADTGVIFTKDASPGDYFNGNTFYNFGFEYAGNSVPMKMGIYGDHGSLNAFFHARFEPNGVTSKINLTQDMIATQFYDAFMQDAWMDHMGAQSLITGVIYGDNGDLLGNMAFGYSYSPTNTYFNERIQIIGTKRSPSGASLLHSNIDVVWSSETFQTVTTSTATVLAGIKTVYVNYTGGTSTITLRPASSSGDFPVTIKNINAINSVTVAGPTTGQTTSILPNMAAEYISNRTAWYDKSQKPATGGGSSPFTVQTHGISYGSSIAAGQNVDPTATLDLYGPNTPSVSNTGLLKIHEQALLNTPENGLHEYFAGRAYYDILGVRKEFLLAPAAGGSAKQLLRWPASGTQLEYADPSFVLSYVQNSVITANNVASASLWGGTHTLAVTNLTTTDNIEAEGSGTFSVSSSTVNVTFAFTFGTSSQNMILISVPTGGYKYKYRFNVTPTSTGTNAGGLVECTLTVYYSVSGTVYTELCNVVAPSTGINTVAPTLAATCSFGITASGNTFSSTKNTIKVLRAN